MNGTGNRTKSIDKSDSPLEQQCMTQLNAIKSARACLYGDPSEGGSAWFRTSVRHALDTTSHHNMFKDLWHDFFRVILLILDIPLNMREVDKWRNWNEIKSIFVMETLSVLCFCVILFVCLYQYKWVACGMSRLYKYNELFLSLCMKHEFMILASQSTMSQEVGQLPDFTRPNVE